MYLYVLPFDLVFILFSRCISCQCNTAGTLNDSTLCDTISGVCNCKQNVQGSDCDECKPGFFSLQSSNSQGCASCLCNTLGTDTTGDICDMVTGECDCVSPATGMLFGITEFLSTEISFPDFLSFTLGRNITENFRVTLLFN